MLYQLKPCTQQDRDWAYALKCEAYREVIERQFGPWNEERQRELFSARWNPGISAAVLVGGRSVGLVAIEERGGELWLDEIQIAREWRGRGLGNRIVLDLISGARKDRKRLKLQVLRENTRAQDFYRRLGFCVIGETDTHYVMEFAS